MNNDNVKRWNVQVNKVQMFKWYQQNPVKVPLVSIAEKHLNL